MAVAKRDAQGDKTMSDGETRRVQLIRAWLSFKVGDVIPVGTDTAGWLKRQGIAKILGGRPKKSDAPPIETASISGSAPENSTKQHAAIRPGVRE